MDVTSIRGPMDGKLAGVRLPPLLLIIIPSLSIYVLNCTDDHPLKH